MAPIEINVKEIVHLLAKEEELVAARKKAEELERENSDMSTRLAKKEQELDLRTQEKVIYRALSYQNRDRLFRSPVLRYIIVSLLFRKTWRPVWRE